MNKEAKYKIGDEIKVISTNEAGTIVKVAAVLGDGYNLYVVALDGKEKMYSESNLELTRKSNPVTDLDVTDVSVELGLNGIVDDIIGRLNLRECDFGLDVVRNACLLQSYLAVNKDYDKEWESIGRNVLKNSIFHGLVNGDLDNISTALVYNYILSKLNMDVKCIACNDEDGNYYLTNLVLVDGMYFYFDPYLEKSVYQDRLAVNENEVFQLCCAGLGKEEYEEFFTPLASLDLNDPMKETKIPDNISESSLDIEFIDRIFGSYYE